MFAHAFLFFPFSGTDVVDRYDYLGYRSDCDERYDDEYYRVASSVFTFVKTFEKICFVNVFLRALERL